MRNVRLVHFYVGVFFAPLIIFFAFTGTLQVFKLHESYRDTPGSQGDWVAWFGQFHKEQAWIPPKVAPAKAAPPKAHEQELARKPMKWLVALLGIALMGSAFAGLYIAFSYPGRRRPCLVALAAGIVIPLALMAF
jgi:uncharacterized iron-regulated membrane protein